MTNQANEKVPFAFAVAKKVPLDDSISILQSGRYDADKQMWINTDNKITAQSCCRATYHSYCTSGCYPGGARYTDSGTHSDCGAPPY